MLVSIVAGGNADACEEISQLAREEIEEIMNTVVPGYQSRQLLQ